MRKNNPFEIIWGCLVCFMAGSVFAVGLGPHLNLLEHFACGFTSANAFIAGLKMIMGLWNWSWRR